MDLIAANRYMTIATADARGKPWVSPVSEHSVRGGLEPWSLKDVTAQAKHRLYCATMREAWVLGPGDERIPLA